MQNIKEKSYCCECNGELRSSEEYYGVCDMCRKMILDYERKQEEE